MMLMSVRSATRWIRPMSRPSPITVGSAIVSQPRRLSSFSLAAASATLASSSQSAG